MCRYSGKNYCGTVASVETVGQFYHLSLIITAAACGRNAAAVFLLSTLIELIIASRFTRIIAFCAILAFFARVSKYFVERFRKCKEVTTDSLYSLSLDGVIL